ncbi:MAG: ABC transporter permease [Candidatus Zophobacter franzmannii]|nr:ABC transporter permease [Candidatus Zophobacter franzmannii]
MRNVLLLIQKEFKQIFRNKAMLAIMFIMPMIQLLILSNAADLELKRVYFAWEDADKSDLSTSLLSKFENNPLFYLTHYSDNQEQNDTQLGNNKADVIISIPNDFERDLTNKIPTTIQLRINAIDGSAGGLIATYSNKIINEFYSDELLKVKATKRIVEARYLYNPALNYKTFMLPGILVILVTVIGLLLTALNIAREKEIGTIEQINVTPIKKHQFILGKLLPMLAIGIGEFILGMAIARLIFHIPVVGNPLVQLLFLVVYLCVMLGIGLLISTRVQTQQQAMFIAFFILMVFMFLSGLFSSIENMPAWGQMIANLIPISYFIRDTRSILLKGAGLKELYPDLIILSIYAVVVNTVAVLAYKKTTD